MYFVQTHFITACTRRYVHSDGNIVHLFPHNSDCAISKPCLVAKLARHRYTSTSTYICVVGGAERGGFSHVSPLQVRVSLQLFSLPYVYKLAYGCPKAFHNPRPISKWENLKIPIYEKEKKPKKELVLSFLAKI